ncbi:uncharacterized protein METZ01_LOCUS403688 [marine metagenome]|uniref:Uncharacterized protein n=1 Tax=marine metagenome TaxID=408172 RepID=A0A382VWI8_9ZZZZ
MEGNKQETGGGGSHVRLLRDSNPTDSLD